MRLDDPLWLWLLPLVLLPFVARPARVAVNGWLAVVPPDRGSQVVGWTLRMLAAAALALLVLALTGPHRPETTVQRVGRGAEIVLVLDRSRSMDQGFRPGGTPPAAGAGGRVTPEQLDYYFSQQPARLRESKGQVARRLLGRFVAERPQDRFALVVFSTLAMRVLDFTDKAEVVQAGVAAGNVGRGLSETNIGQALEVALEYFDGRPYTGSRLLMLVSDGGDRMDADTQQRLARRLQAQRVSVYWLYLRGANNRGLAVTAGDSAQALDSVPELLLHRFLGGAGVPYRAYEASDSQALERAIDDVNRLEKLPITYHDVIPRRELLPAVLGAALVCVLLLLAARALTLRPEGRA